MLKNTILFSLILLAGCGTPAPQPQTQQEPSTPGPAPAQAPDVADPAQTALARPSPMGSPELTGSAGNAVEPARVEPARIAAGTSIRVRLASTIDTSRNKAGDSFTATLDAPVKDDGRVILPKGTLFHGHLTESKSSGRLRGRAVLGLTLDSFELNGRTYTVRTGMVVRTSADHKRRNIGLIGGGSGIGAAIGALVGGGKGALIGAGAGAAAGTAGAAATGKRNVRLPVETPLTFTIRGTVQV